MSAPVAVTARSGLADRLRAIAPRLLVWATLLVLCAAGLRAVIAPAPKAAPERRAPTALDLPAAGFAEDFARAYLTADPNRPERRERALATYLPDGLDGDGGMTPTGSAARRVAWTAAVAQQEHGRRLTVTVAADTSDGRIHLAVPVVRDERGYLSLGGYPAVVGAPAVDLRADPLDEDDVAEPSLRAVAERAVRNYLAGEHRNLLADLAPGVVVSLPERRMSARSVRSITWADPGRVVALEVDARDQAEARWTLRYELRVLRRDRWYVAAIHTNPTSRGGT